MKIYLENLLTDFDTKQSDKCKLIEKLNNCLHIRKV